MSIGLVSIKLFAKYRSLVKRCVFYQYLIRFPTHLYFITGTMYAGLFVHPLASFEVVHLSR